MTYLLHTEPDDNGTLLVTCVAFPEVTTFGEDKPQAWRHGLSAIEEAIAARISDGLDIPREATQQEIKRAPVDSIWVKLPLLTTLKVELYRALRSSDVKTRAELARRMGKPREQIDRLFRLDHQSRTDQIESAFRALNRGIDVRTPKLVAGEGLEPPTSGL